MGLPIQQTKSKDLQIMQTTWSNQLNPLVANPLLKGHLIQNVLLESGSNSINHGLGRALQGWIITGMHNSFIQVYDTQAFNQMPQLTLQLHASGAGSLDLYVF